MSNIIQQHDGNQPISSMSQLLEELQITPKRNAKGLRIFSTSQIHKLAPELHRCKPPLEPRRA